MKNLGLLLLRVVAGGTLVAHGYSKLFGGEGRQAPAPLQRAFGPQFEQAVERGGPASFAKVLEDRGIPSPGVASYLSGLTELVGGLALVTGTKTRLAALAVLANMAVAIRTVHWEKGFFGQGGYEFPAQVMAEAATLALAGPGALSVDGLMRGARRTAEAVDAMRSSSVEGLAGGTRKATAALGSVRSTSADRLSGGTREASRRLGSLTHRASTDGLARRARTARRGLADLRPSRILEAVF